MVDCSGFENRRAVMSRPLGSNPRASAIIHRNRELRLPRVLCGLTLDRKVDPEGTQRMTGAEIMFLLYPVAALALGLIIFFLTRRADRK